MPGVRRTYKARGKKRLLRTPYRYLAVHEHDWYNMRRLSDKLGLSIVDTVAVLVAKNLEAYHVDHLTAEDLLRMEKTALSPAASDS